jgi:hypothetical protein
VANRKSLDENRLRPNTHIQMPGLRPARKKLLDITTNQEISPRELAAE